MYILTHVQPDITEEGYDCTIVHVYIKSLLDIVTAWIPTLMNLYYSLFGFHSQTSTQYYFNDVLLEKCLSTFGNCR